MTILVIMSFFGWYNDMVRVLSYGRFSFSASLGEKANPIHFVWLLPLKVQGCV